MVVGESGLGKSTLVNSLFLSDLYSNRKIPPVDERAGRTTEIEKTTMEIEEKGVKVILCDLELTRSRDSYNSDLTVLTCTILIQ